MPEQDIITRFETMSKAQQHMEGETYEKAEEWLNENEENYLKAICG